MTVFVALSKSEISSKLNGNRRKAYEVLLECRKEALWILDAIAPPDMQDQPEWLGEDLFRVTKWMFNIICRMGDPSLKIVGTSLSSYKTRLKKILFMLVEYSGLPMTDAATCASRAQDFVSGMISIVAWSERRMTNIKIDAKIERDLSSIR